ncbi:hypothetical protein Hanom_Chr09g00810721 [Helianthus anomalus]
MVSSSITFANLLLIFSGVGVSRFPSVSLLLLCRYILLFLLVYVVSVDNFYCVLLYMLKD